MRRLGLAWTFSAGNIRMAFGRSNQVHNAFTGACRKVPLALRCSAPDLGLQPLEVVRRYLTEQDSQKIG